MSFVNIDITPFGRLCHAVLFYLLRSVYTETQSNSSHRISSFKKQYIKLNLDIDLNKNITYTPVIYNCTCFYCSHSELSNLGRCDKSECKCDECKLMEKKYPDVKNTKFSFKFHEFIYGKQIGSFTERDNSPEFWRSHWGYNFSPFRIAQHILKCHNIYLVDHTLYGKKLHAFIWFAPPPINHKVYYWHHHNVISDIKQKNKLSVDKLDDNFFKMRNNLKKLYTTLIEESNFTMLFITSSMTSQFVNNDVIWFSHHYTNIPLKFIF